MNGNYTEKVEKVLRRIRESRKLKGFSHENMASMLDMSVSAYNKLERNETTLSFERLLCITDALETPLSEILDIKTGYTLHQDLRDNSIGKVETKALYQESKDKTEKIEELYKALLKEKDETIAVLKNIIESKK